MINIPDIRAQFPILGRKVNGAPLVYFDNAATTQKPERVICAVSDFYRRSNANIHRGVHTLSREATDLYEQARSTVAAADQIRVERRFRGGQRRAGERAEILDPSRGEAGFEIGEQADDAIGLQRPRLRRLGGGRNRKEQKNGQQGQSAHGSRAIAAFAVPGAGGSPGRVGRN